MDAATRDEVRRRADNRCEYCQLHQQHSYTTHHIEHIVAKQHDGSEALENLALACAWCNLHKGPNLTGVDPISSEIVSLFHPRRDQWRIKGAPLDVAGASIFVFRTRASKGS